MCLLFCVRVLRASTACLLAFINLRRSREEDGCGASIVYQGNGWQLLWYFRGVRMIFAWSVKPNMAWRGTWRPQGIATTLADGTMRHVLA